MVETALLRQLEGFSLTTAEILYRLPDYPRLLQSYVWQDFDLAPKFPKLLRFLNFWQGRSTGCASLIDASSRRRSFASSMVSSDCTDVQLDAPSRQAHVQSN